jgi:hypothetical protein
MRDVVECSATALVFPAGSGEARFWDKPRLWELRIGAYAYEIPASADVCLFRLDLDDPDFGENAVPVRSYLVETESEIAFVARLERRGRYWLHINIGIACADQLHLLRRIVLRHLVSHVAKEHLDRDSRNCAVPFICDVAIKISDLAAGKIGGFAHFEVTDGQIRGIGIERRSRRQCRGSALSAPDNDQRNHHGNDDGGGYADWQPVSIARFCRTY